MTLEPEDKRGRAITVYLTAESTCDVCGETKKCAWIDTSRADIALCRDCLAYAIGAIKARGN